MQKQKQKSIKLQFLTDVLIDLKNIFFMLVKLENPKIQTTKKDTKYMDDSLSIRKKKLALYDYTDGMDPESSCFASDNQRQSYYDCWKYMPMEVYMDCSWKIHTKRSNAGMIYCQHRWCPICEKRKLHNIKSKVKDFIATDDLSKKNWYYIVLTVKHTKMDTLDTIFQKITWSKKKLSDKYRKDMQEIKNWWLAKSFFGIFDWLYWIIETTKTKNWWNVHMNIIWCTDQDIPLKEIKSIDKKWNYKTTTINEKLVAEWKKVTKDSKIVSVNKLDFSNSQSKQNAIQEVFKYSLKDDDLYMSDKVEFLNYTKWKRLKWWWGCLRGMLAMKDDLIDDTDDTDDENDGIDYSTMIKLWLIFYRYQESKNRKLSLVKCYKVNLQSDFDDSWYQLYPDRYDPHDTS